MAEQLLHKGFRFYQSANADAESIKEGFIIRQNEYEIIIEDIRRNNMQGSVQHYLLLGRRGSGKSTLLRRIQIEIDTDEKLQNSYIAINLAEEQANIYRLSDLWEEILQEMEHAGVEVSYPDWDDDTQSYSRKLIDAVHTAITKSGKKVILLLDNIDRIFENLKEDASLLREYLLNFDDLKIIGGSTRMTEHFWKYDQPFYEFFRVLQLNPLTSQEVKTLLLFWAEKLGQPELKTFVEKQRGQLETVRILTDGLPRTLQFFVNILLTNTQETGYEYLRLIMDQVTPLYQERLNNLPPSQRKIVLQMAFIWEATGTKELAAVTHMDNKLISAQLKQLADKGIVDIIKTDTKNNLYRLSERFFNLWLIFTQGSPHEKRKAKYLTIFLENFYDKDQLKQLAVNHIKLLQSGILDPNKAALLTKAFAQSRHITFLERDELIRNTISLKGVNFELKQQLPLLTDDIYKKIDLAVENMNWPKALILANEIEQDSPRKWFILGYIYFQKGSIYEAEKNYLIAAENGYVAASFNLGIIYVEQNKFDLAEKFYLQSASKGYADASFNLGIIYNKQNKVDLAEKFYLKAVEEGDISSLFNLGSLYFRQQNLELAEKYYLLAIEKGHVNALVSLGNLYIKQENFKLAENYYLQAIDQDHIGALFNLGYLYCEKQDFELAQKYYLKAIKKGHIDALINLGNLYLKQQNYESAEKYYLQAIEKGDVYSLFNLGYLYDHQNKSDLAEKYYLRASENGDTYALNNLGILYDKQQRYKLAKRNYLLAVENGDITAMVNLGFLYHQQKKFKLAEKYYLQAAESGNVNAIFNLGVLYNNQGRIDLAEKYYLQAVEKGYVGALSTLSLFYYKQNKNKTEAKFLIDKYLDKKIDSIHIHGLSSKAIIYLWTGDIKVSETLLKELLANRHNNQEETDKSIHFTLIQFLVHYQIQFVKNIFEVGESGKELTLKFAPVYYATLLLNENDSNISLKIPPEIRDTVDNILEEVKDGQRFYYGK